MEVFGNYQTSGMGTQKWHLLNYIPDSIREDGGVEYLHAGVLEGAHRISKRQQRKRLWKRKSALEEPLGRPMTAASFYSSKEQN